MKKEDEYKPIDEERNYHNFTIAGTDSETLDAAPSNKDRDNHKSSVSTLSVAADESLCHERSLVVGFVPNNPFEYRQNNGRHDLECQGIPDASFDHCEHRDDAQDTERCADAQASNNSLLIDRIAVLERELEWARRQHAFIAEQQKRQRKRDKRRAMQEARREVRENSHELKGVLENLEQEMAQTVERVRQDCQRHHELDLILALEKERLKLKAEHDTVMQDVAAAFDQERSQLKAEHDTLMQDVKAAFEKERSQLVAEHDATLQKATGSLKEELVAFKREAVQKWQEYHQEQLDRQVQLQSDHKEQLSALERSTALVWEEHYLVQIEQLLQDQRDQILETRPQTAQEVEQLLQHLDAAHQNELKELQLVHQTRLQEQMLEHEGELKEIRGMLHVNSELLERSRKEIKAEKDVAVKEAVRKATRSFQKEMRMLVLNHSDRVDKLCQRHQEDIQEQRLSFEVERLNDREQTMHEKLTLVKEYQRQIEQLGLDHELELGRLRRKHENALEDQENMRLAECTLLQSQLIRLRQQQAKDEYVECNQNTERRGLYAFLECRASIEKKETETNQTNGGPIALPEEETTPHAPVVEVQSCCFSDVEQEISYADSEQYKIWLEENATQGEQKTQNVHAFTQVKTTEAPSRSTHVVEGQTQKELLKTEDISRAQQRQGAAECQMEEKGYKQLEGEDGITVTLGASQRKNALICRDEGSNNAVQTVLALQKAQFEEIINAQALQLREATEYWEQQKKHWDESMIQLEEQGMRSQAELHDHYQYELRHVHRAMDAAIIEAQSHAATFVRTGMQKLKDMEKERDEMIKHAVRAALEQQKMEFDGIIESQKVLLKEANARLEALTDLEADSGTHSVSRIRDPKLCDLETHRDQMINQDVEEALTQQKAEFEKVTRALKYQLRETTEYWEQQKAHWDASAIQLEEQGKRAQSELHDHYHYELRHVHRAMDAAIVEAQSQAATFVRTGMQKLKDMETEQDETIKLAVRAALEQQKMEFDGIFNSQKVLLKDANADLVQQPAPLDLRAESRTHSISRTRDSNHSEIGTDRDQMIDRAVEVAVSQQKTEFEEITRAHESQLRDATEYWEQQKAHWEASTIQLEEQGKRAQSELHDHYQYELRNVHQAMDAAIVEAQSQAATFVRTGVQKLKDMETEQDEMIKHAVGAALEQQKMEFDGTFNSQKVRLKEVNADLVQHQPLFDLEAETCSQSVSRKTDPNHSDIETKSTVCAQKSQMQEATMHWEQQKRHWNGSNLKLEVQGQRSQSELHNHYQCELRDVHRGKDAAMSETQSEASTLVRTGAQKLAGEKLRNECFPPPKCHLQAIGTQQKEQGQAVSFFGDAIELQDLSQRNALMHDTATPEGVRRNIRFGIKKWKALAGKIKVRERHAALAPLASDNAAAHT